MRIPNLTMSDALVSRLNTLNVQQSHFNDQLSNGQRITLASEDPQAAARILRLRTESGAVQTYNSNNDRAVGVAQASFAALNRLKTISDRATELATLSADSTVSQAERQAYGAEAAQLVASAIESANTTYQGEYLFNGTNTLSTTAPFAEANGAVQTAMRASVAPTANPNVVSIASASEFANVSVGQVVTGSGIPTGTTVTAVNAATKTITLSNAAGSATTLNFFSSGAAMKLSESVSFSTFNSATGNSQIATFIQNLISLRDALNNKTATPAASTATIAATKTKLLATEDSLVGMLAENGALQTRMESIKAQNVDRVANMESLISKDADVDTAQTMVNLTRARTSYQAAMQAGAQVLKLSLLDYI